MFATLAHRFAWMRRSLLTVWISALLIGLAGWAVAAAIVVMMVRVTGGVCG